MPNVPYKAENPEDDEEYETVSFEDVCDKSPSSKTDLLTLNDNINYRLRYENDKPSKFEYVGESSSAAEKLTETSLNGSKNCHFKGRKSFTPFGKHNPKVRAPLSGIIPKPKSDDAGSSREHRYQRFSERRNMFQRCYDGIPRVGTSVLAVLLVFALCVGGWWAVSAVITGPWQEEHYRKLWERAHPDTIKNPQAPMTHEKVSPEFRYHDHNNLSTKNKNATEQKKKTDNTTDYKKNEYIIDLDVNDTKDFSTEMYSNEVGATEKKTEKKSVGNDAQLPNDVCANVEVNKRFDCYPQPGASQKGCEDRGCCWRSTSTKGAPYCFYPPHYDTFKFVNMTEGKRSMSVFYEKNRPSGYRNDFETVEMQFTYLTESILKIVINEPGRNDEASYPNIQVRSTAPGTLQYRVVVDEAKPGFKVVRTSDNVTIINAQNVGGLILSDKFLQLSILLPEADLYGLGERRGRLKLDPNWTTVAMFNRDRAPVEGANLYGTQPFYLAVEPSGNSHGVLLHNTYAMDVTLQPGALTWRVVGGALALYVVTGPAPSDVVAQHQRLVGRAALPPYWALGFHLCKFDYGSLNVTERVWQTNRDAGIPFDVQWNDIDYMDRRNDFTYDKTKFAGLPQFVNKLHSEGMHYMVIIDPGISASEKPGTYPPYDRGMELDVFIKNSTNQPFVGKVWNAESTVFTDFSHVNVSTYWTEMLTNLHKDIPFDGIWIDMNEPSNAIDGELHRKCSPENLQYMPRTGDAALSAHTVCMAARHYRGPHARLHNVYALLQQGETYLALATIRGKRPFIISRATFSGSGRVSGHWSGDVASTWHDMQMSIPELLSFSLFGIPMMGSDICGFRGDTTVELCKRWMQLGAFYPFSRNHNSDSSIPQDPVSLGPEVVAASRKALLLRYKLLPYYYTQFWLAHTSGATVATPLFFVDPKNPALRDIDTQFLIGSYVLITPILQPGANSTRGLFPGPSAWYRLDGRAITGEVDVTDEDIVVIKGGGVVPTQEPPSSGAVTVGRCRARPLRLLAVPSVPHHRAVGQLYWDDGDSINSYNERKFSHVTFSLNETSLQSTTQWWGYGAPSLDRVTVFAQPEPSQVWLDGLPCTKPCDFSYQKDTKVLTINVLLSFERSFNIRWSPKSEDD